MSFLDAPLHIERDEADLYVEQVGPADAPPLLYLHGGPGYSSFSFRDLIGEELERYRMIYADQRGSGRSYAHAECGLDDLADDAAAILMALQLPRATLLAHGFGALIAVRTALRHPELAERLVLVNPWFSMPMLARALHRQASVLAGETEGMLPPESVIAEGEGPAPQELVDEAFGKVPGTAIFDSLQFPDASSRLRLEHSDATALFGPDEFAMPGEPWTLDVLAELPRLDLPIVVTASAEDGTSYPDQAEAGLERMPGALFSLLPGGHYPWIDAPDEFLELLEQALEVG